MQKVFMENASPSAVGLANESGWMASFEFVKFMAHFMKHAHETKKLAIHLVLGNTASHLSVEFTDMVVSNEITKISLTLYCSHHIKLQIF